MLCGPHFPWHPDFEDQLPGFPPASRPPPCLSLWQALLPTSSLEHCCSLLVPSHDKYFSCVSQALTLIMSEAELSISHPNPALPRPDSCPSDAPAQERHHCPQAAQARNLWKGLVTSLSLTRYLKSLPRLALNISRLFPSVHPQCHNSCLGSWMHPVTRPPASLPSSHRPFLQTADRMDFLKHKSVHITLLFAPLSGLPLLSGLGLNPCQGFQAFYSWDDLHPAVMLLSWTTAQLHCSYARASGLSPPCASYIFLLPTPTPQPGPYLDPSCAFR